MLPHHLVSSVVRHVKGSKGHLSRQINCYASNAGTGGISLNGVGWQIANVVAGAEES